MFNFITEMTTNDFITLAAFAIACGSVSIISHIAKKTTNKVDDKIAESLEAWKKELKEEIAKKYKK